MLFKVIFPPTRAQCKVIATPRNQTTRYICDLSTTYLSGFYSKVECFGRNMHHRWVPLDWTSEESLTGGQYKEIEIIESPMFSAIPCTEEIAKHPNDYYAIISCHDMPRVFTFEDLDAFSNYIASRLAAMETASYNTVTDIMTIGLLAWRLMYVRKNSNEVVACFGDNH